MSFIENPEDFMDLIEIRHLLWGEAIDENTFRNWSQGFIFSQQEPSALVQLHGGPCGVLAPIQAYIIKRIMDNGMGHNIHHLSRNDCNEMLIEALCDIMGKCATQAYRIVEVDQAKYNYFCQLPESERFHQSLSVRNFYSMHAVNAYYWANLQELKEDYAVLCFLYSILLSKGSNNILDDLSERDATLIEDRYGHTNQPIVNLILTGEAVSEVGDYETVVGGMRLKGISQQSEIGFLTVRDQVFVRVGTFLKNPSRTIWVTASENHYTVLFSFDNRLMDAGPDEDELLGENVFGLYDDQGTGYINTDLLELVMDTLGLETDPRFIVCMKSTLDPYNTGRISRDNFMNEFFPNRNRVTEFSLMHYNGLRSSNYEREVKYNEGLARLANEEGDWYTPHTPLLTCLRKKWSSIEVNWFGPRPPSL